MSALALSTPAQAHPSGQTGIVSRLRLATRVEHARTEALVDLSTQLESLGAYARLLSAFLSFHDALIPALDDVLAFAPDALTDGPRHRRRRCAADLAALGCAPPAPLVTAGVDGLGSLDRQLGAWYVLEGSALGGAVIARAARRALPEAERIGALSFLTGEDAAPGARWRRFVAFADELDRSEALSFSAVRAGAGLAFDTFARIGVARFARTGAVR